MPSMGRSIEAQSSPSTSQQNNIPETLKTRREVLQDVVQGWVQQTRSRFQEIDGIDLYSSGVEQGDDKKISRRGAIIWAGKRTGEAIMLGVVITAAPELLKPDPIYRQLEVHKESSEEFEKTGELQVRRFASEIMQTSKVISENTTEFFKVQALTGAFLANMGIAAVLKDRSNLAARIAGVICFNSGALVDGLSTLASTRYMQDPRFVEYGFDGLVYENSLVIPSNPTQGDIYKAHTLRTLVMTPISFIAYPLGRIYLGMSPAIGNHNLKLAHTIKTGLDFGDQVKGLIANGAGEEEVRNYLRSEAKVSNT